MNPSLMLCLMICPLGLLAMTSLFHFELWIPAAIVTAITCYPLGITGWQIVRFTKHDANRLQGEQHIERMLQISQMVGMKQGDKITEIAVSGELSGNPALEDRSGE